MSTLEKQKELLQEKIKNIDDEQLIERILNMVNEEAPVYELSEEQKRRILKGKQEIAEGKGISNEEVKRRTAEWLKARK